MTAVETNAIDERLRAGELYFAAEAERIAALCLELARAFVRGGRLLAVGGSAQDWSDARHVAVEFVHPVIVGKRALPAIAVARDVLEQLQRDQDATIEFEPLRVTLGGEEWRFDVPSADPFVRQEIAETTYHLLWELVHVFFDHLGGSNAGAGASGFLYPFLEQREVDLDGVVADVRRSVLLKAGEVAKLRLRTLEDGRRALAAAAAAMRTGGMTLVFGNGGSATDAEDLVADLRGAPQGWPARRALDLTDNGAILTALANDVGAEVLFQRQVIAHGAAGDVAIAISTSGGSANVILALEEARRRGLVTVAFLGYDGGRIAAEALADHVVVAPSQHIPRIQEAQASAYHVLRELVEL
ncbi:MAG: SIS domain-containing protein [Gaiellaceae bacterium]